MPLNVLAHCLTPCIENLISAYTEPQFAASWRNTHNMGYQNAQAEKSYSSQSGILMIRMRQRFLGVKPRPWLSNRPVAPAGVP